jgi:hypothetical protein
LGVDVEDLLEGPALAGRGGGVSTRKAGVLRESELRAETDELVEMDTEEFSDYLTTLTDSQLVDLQGQLMLLLRYRYIPKGFHTWEEVDAYTESPEKKRGDKAGELLRMTINAIEARAKEMSEARTKALEPA